MFIIVESGSTKADWMVINGEDEQMLNTVGFNPYFHSEQFILKELVKNDGLFAIKDEVEELFFYGAGCSSPELNNIIKKGLTEFFTKALIHINHDLDACAYACYNDKPTIACILGTGSNSCYYDGTTVSEAIPALGHILGDEASGSYFGKKILADFLYNRLPKEIHEECIRHGLNKETIIDRVYRKPDANVYIASMMPILIKSKKLTYAQDLIKTGLQEFVDTHIKCYDNFKECDVSFVGSLAYLLSAELKQVCSENDIKLNLIIRRPLEMLVQYHKKDYLVD